VVFVGGTFTGKRALADVFADRPIGETPAQTVVAREVKGALEVDGVPVELGICDISGQDRFKSTATLFLRHADIVFVVFSLIDRQSFREADTWIDTVVEVAGDHTQICLVGNKADCSDKRVVNVDEAESLSFSHANGRYVETSALTKQGIPEPWNAAAHAVRLLRHWRKKDPAPPADLGEEDAACC
jgi:small GTP-binding protein